TRATPSRWPSRPRRTDRTTTHFRHDRPLLTPLTNDSSVSSTTPSSTRRSRPQPYTSDQLEITLRHRYATIITDAETGRRVAVLPDREAATLESWLREHPGVEVVCRDGSATYAEAVRRALPDAVQVSDRWHLWRNLCDKVQLEVR